VNGAGENRLGAAAQHAADAATQGASTWLPGGIARNLADGVIRARYRESLANHLSFNRGRLTSTRLIW